MEAQEVAVPTGMSIDPWFDWAPVINVPVHVYITFGFILLFIAVNIYWLVRMGKLSSVKGWAESLKKMTPIDVQVWVITRTQKLFIECMAIKDNVISSLDPQNLSMWYVSSPMGIIRVGGQTAVVVSEDFDRNRDWITEIALCENLDQFNDNQQNLKKYVDEKYKQESEKNPDIEKPKVIKPITGFQSYDDHGRKCLESIYPDGLTIPAYNLFNPNRFRKYFPKANSSLLFGGELTLESRDWNVDKREKTFWEIHAFMIMAAGIVMILTMAIWFFPMGA